MDPINHRIDVTGHYEVDTGRRRSSAVEDNVEKAHACDVTGQELWTQVLIHSSEEQYYGSYNASKM